MLQIQSVLVVDSSTASISSKLEKSIWNDEHGIATLRNAILCEMKLRMLWLRTNVLCWILHFLFSFYKVRVFLFHVSIVYLPTPFISFPSAESPAMVQALLNNLSNGLFPTRRKNTASYIKKLHIETPSMDGRRPSDLISMLERCEQLEAFVDLKSARSGFGLVGVGVGGGLNRG
jgi:hypothetical protein